LPLTPIPSNFTNTPLFRSVYGLADFPRDGAAAEFAAVRAANLELKPRSIPHVEAAFADTFGADRLAGTLRTCPPRCRTKRVDPRDRKSTRLNSSHRTISYA